jgi:aspartate kinase
VSRVIVQKYGGSSVATPEKLRRVADLIVERKRSGVSLVVVVSAMGDTTDELLGLANAVSENPPRRELDMLLTCGERISMALLSMAIAERGERAISFTGSQSGIITDEHHFAAKIVEIRPHRIELALAEGKIVIVAGYQGMSTGREITTLGRGGSDTSAVALAAALDAEACEIYSDVDGVYSSDPRIVSEAERIPTLSYQEMETLALAGAKVLNADAVAFARERGITIHAKKTGAEPSAGTIISAKAPRMLALAGVANKASLWDVCAPASEVFFSTLKRFGAKPEACLVEPGKSARCALDLENIPDSDALRRALSSLGAVTAAVDVVSLVGESISTRIDIVSQALMLASSATRIIVETHRIAAVVAEKEGANVCRAWHGAFFNGPQ